MMSQNVKLALIQHSCSTNQQANIFQTIKSIKSASKEGAQIMLLQELFNTTYFCQSVDEQFFELAQPIPGPMTDQLCGLAGELEIVIVAPFFEKRTAGIYHNSLVVIDADGTLMGRYRKKHIPEDPGFHEKYYFTPGDDEYQVFDTQYAKIGTLICWDQWYPEAARITALKGAELLVYPTAIGTLADESLREQQEFLNAWQTMQQSHAIANGCYMASINRVGREADISFWGHSFVSGPFGQIQAEAGSDDEVLTAAIDLASIEKQRQQWPFFRDRRIDSYEPVLERFLDSDDQ